MPYYPQRSDPEPPNRPPRKLITPRRITLCVSVLLIGYGLVRLIGYCADLLSTRQTTQELRQIAGETETADVPDPATSPATVSPAPTTIVPKEDLSLPDKLPAVQYPNGYQLVSRIQKLRKKHGYIIGWITMDDGLDEPVVQKDNSFFLDHDATGKRNVNGAIFMDEETSLMTRPYTVLLYGHNMKTGAMFGSLKKYEDFSYCFRHRVFQFDTLYEEGRYAVFAVSTVSLSPGNSRYVSFSDLCSTERTPRRSALSALIRCSVHESMLEVNEEDQLLLLVTCVGDDDERLIVAARRLRENEQPDHLLLRNAASLWFLSPLS